MPPASRGWGQRLRGSARISLTDVRRHGRGTTVRRQGCRRPGRGGGDLKESRGRRQGRPGAGPTVRASRRGWGMTGRVHSVWSRPGAGMRWAQTSPGLLPW